MKHDLKNRNVEKFTRDLIKHFGRVKSREILHFLLERAKDKDMQDFKTLATESLVEMDKYKEKKNKE